MRKIIFPLIALIYGASWLESQTGLPITKYTVHAVKTMGSVKDWGVHDWAGAGSLLLFTVLGLRKILFWRPQKVKVIHDVHEIEVAAKVPKPKPTSKDHYEEGIKYAYDRIIEETDEALGNGMSQEPFPILPEEAQLKALSHYRELLPHLNFSWTKDHSKHDLLLKWNIKEMDVSTSKPTIDGPLPYPLTEFHIDRLERYKAALLPVDVNH